MKTTLKTLGAIVAAVAIALTTGGATLTNCVAEDSTNCYWDAETLGNGHGDSFVDLFGTVIYLP